MTGVNCPVCDKNYHANTRKCPDCGAPNPRKEEKAGEPQETTEKSAPAVGTAEPAVDAAVDDTGKESEAAGGTTLQDDRVYEETIKHLEEQMEQEKQKEELLKRERRVRELQMELAGMRVGNREIRREIDVGTAVFTGAMQGLSQQFPMPSHITVPAAEIACIY